MSLPHFLDNQLKDDGEVVNLYTDCFLHTGKFLVLISVRSSVDFRSIEQLEKLGQFKIPSDSWELNL
jgi:hypothetical protein